MSNAAPTATQPLPSNDSHPSRPVYFQTPTGAERHAVKLAMAASTDGLARPVEFAPRTFRGGSRFFCAESAAPSDDYVVRELSAAEVTRRQQAGIRSAKESCEIELKSHLLVAGAMRSGSCFHRIHLQRAAQLRDRIRELETMLTASAVAS